MYHLNKMDDDDMVFLLVIWNIGTYAYLRVRLVEGMEK